MSNHKTKRNRKRKVKRRSTHRGGHGLMTGNNGRMRYKEETAQYQQMMAGLAARSQCAMSDSERVDLYPTGTVTNESQCINDGGCWSPAKTANVPWCFVPGNCAKYVKRLISK